MMAQNMQQVKTLSCNAHQKLLSGFEFVSKTFQSLIQCFQDIPRSVVPSESQFRWFFLIKNCPVSLYFIAATFRIPLTDIDC